MNVVLEEDSRVIIFGCGGHSRSVVDVLLSYKPGISLIFVDSQAKPKETLYGFDIITHIDSINLPYFFAIGSNERREEICQRIGSSRLISIISPKASLGKNSHLENGLFIGNFCHIGPEAQIGGNSILNNGCIVEHEVVIGKYSHIGPRAVISGRSRIGDRVFIGVGAVVKDSISICSNVIAGAGAVIVKDITDPGIYVGCPAKKIKPFPHKLNSLKKDFLICS